MKLACKSFSGGTLKESVIKGLPRDANGNYPVDIEIQVMSLLFVELQEKRHVADYDRTDSFFRSEIITLNQRYKKGVDRFRQLPASDQRRFFLLCLMTWKELANR